MGNRAVVGWKNRYGEFKRDSVGVYLHWNGGRDSIEAFLAYCEACGFRNPSEDDYGVARFVQVVANFFNADGLSIGVNTIEHLDADNGDNGLYICDGWKIVGRECFDGEEQNVHDFAEMLLSINARQPEELRKSEEMLRAMAVSRSVPEGERPSVFAPEDL